MVAVASMELYEVHSSTQHVFHFLTRLFSHSNTAYLSISYIISSFIPHSSHSTSANDPTSNMIPLRELFKEELPEATDDTPVYKGPLSRTLSDTRPFHKLEHFDEDEFLNRLKSPEATARLSRVVQLVNTESDRVLRKEVDVVRMGYEHLTHPVSLAFPEMTQVSEQSRTHSYTLWKLGDEVATILVFTRYGMIEPIRWGEGDMRQKAHELTLSQYIRM